MTSSWPTFLLAVLASPLFATIFADAAAANDIPPSLLVNADFERHAASGTYRKTMVPGDFTFGGWNGGLYENRAQIIKGTSPSNMFLRILYPRGAVGPSTGGAQFKVVFDDDDDRRYTEMYVRYRVRFAANFDFVKGGKIPGLCGGDCNTGGDKPNGRDGWSARLMWRADGEIVQYLYHPDQPTTYGEDLPWRASGGTGARLRFIPGRWHTVETYVKLNTPGVRDGVVRSWFDGELALDRNNIRYRDTASITVDTFYFSTFFGGSGSDWAPTKAETVDFDDVAISTVPFTTTYPASSPASIDQRSTTTRVPVTTLAAATTTRAPPASSTSSPSPPPPSGNGGGSCGLQLAVKKVKEYYLRFSATPRSSGAVVVVLNGKYGHDFALSANDKYYYGSVDKITASRTLEARWPDGRVARYQLSVPLSGHDKGDVLPCSVVQQRSSSSRRRSMRRSFKALEAVPLCGGVRVIGDNVKSFYIRVGVAVPAGSGLTVSGLSLTSPSTGNYSLKFNFANTDGVRFFDATTTETMAGTTQTLVLRLFNSSSATNLTHVFAVAFDGSVNEGDELPCASAGPAVLTETTTTTIAASTAAEQTATALQTTAESPSPPTTTASTTSPSAPSTACDRSGLEMFAENAGEWYTRVRVAISPDASSSSSSVQEVLTAVLSNANRSDPQSSLQLTRRNGTAESISSLSRVFDSPTARMVAAETLTITASDGSVYRFAVPYNRPAVSPGQRLTCLADNQGPSDAPSTTDDADPVSPPARSDAFLRVKLHGSHFGAAIAANRTALLDAAVEDLTKAVNIDPDVHRVVIRNATVGSLVVDLTVEPVHDADPEDAATLDVASLNAAVATATAIDQVGWTDNRGSVVFATTADSYSRLANVPATDLYMAAAATSTSSEAAIDSYTSVAAASTLQRVAAAELITRPAGAAAPAQPDDAGCQMGCQAAIGGAGGVILLAGVSLLVWRHRRAATEEKSARRQMAAASHVMLAADEQDGTASSSSMVAAHSGDQNNDDDDDDHDDLLLGHYKAPSTPAHAAAAVAKGPPQMRPPEAALVPSPHDLL